MPKKSTKVPGTNVSEATYVAADLPKEERVKFMRRVNTFVQSAPDDVRDYLNAMYLISREFDFAVSNALALIPFYCDDGVTRWAMFKSTSVANLPPIEVQEAISKGEQHGSVNPDEMLVMDLAPISLGLSADPLEAIRQAKLQVSPASDEVN